MRELLLRRAPSRMGLPGGGPHRDLLVLDGVHRIQADTLASLAPLLQGGDLPLPRRLSAAAPRGGRLDIGPARRQRRTRPVSTVGIDCAARPSEPATMPVSRLPAKPAQKLFFRASRYFLPRTSGCVRRARLGSALSRPHLCLLLGPGSVWPTCAAEPSPRTVTHVPLHPRRLAGGTAAATTWSRVSIIGGCFAS